MTQLLRERIQETCFSVSDKVWVNLKIALWNLAKIALYASALKFLWSFFAPQVFHLPPMTYGNALALYIFVAILKQMS